MSERDLFPESWLAAATDLDGSVVSGAVRLGDGDLIVYRFTGLSDQVTWRKCDCPWWHRLPLVGRFVHAELP